MKTAPRCSRTVSNEAETGTCKDNLLSRKPVLPDPHLQEDTIVKNSRLLQK